MTMTSRLRGRAEEGPAVLRPVTNLAAWIALAARAKRVRLPNPLRLLSLEAGLWLLGAVLLIVVTMVMLDARAATASRQLPVWLVRGFDEITDFGKSAWFLWPLFALLVGLAIAAATIARRFTQLIVTSLAVRLWFLFVAVAVPGLTADVIKRIGRARPFVTGTADPFAFSWFDFRAAYASFPSGHATTACAAAVAFGALWPKLRPILWAYAAVIVLSRVVITAHYPSDVLGGAMLGALGAVLVRNWFAARRLVFTVNADGRISALPGPSLHRIKAVIRAFGHGAESVSPMGGNTAATASALGIAPTSPSAVFTSPRVRGEVKGPRIVDFSGAHSDVGETTPGVCVVVPVRNESGNIAPLVAEIAAALDSESFEVVYVNDGSSDATESELQRLIPERPWLRQMKHAQSCGQSAAVRTGVAAARAAIIITIDGDGQNDPAFIPALLQSLRAGAPTVGLVAGQRVGRKASGFKRLQSRVANAVRAFVLNDGTRDTGCGLKAFYRDVFLRLPYFDGLHRFLPALMRREGYDIGYVDVVDRTRLHGRSNYGLWDRLWVGILDLVGVWWLIRRRKRVPVISEVN
jgi:dolichol-phosphate mannosyltransferase